MNRRQVLGGCTAAIAIWSVPSILTAGYAGGSTLSFEPAGVPAVQPPAQQSLAFTGDDNERDAILGFGLIGAGWWFRYWNAREWK